MDAPSKQSKQNLKITASVYCHCMIKFEAEVWNQSGLLHSTDCLQQTELYEALQLVSGAEIFHMCNFDMDKCPSTNILCSCYGTYDLPLEAEYYYFSFERIYVAEAALLVLEEPGAGATLF